MIKKGVLEFKKAVSLPVPNYRGAQDRPDEWLDVHI